MFRHVVLFRFKPEATEDQRKLLAAELAKLPDAVPSLRRFVTGADAGAASGNFDFAVTADFDDMAGWVAYRDNPAHRSVVDKYLTPILAERAAIQFEY